MSGVLGVLGVLGMSGMSGVGNGCRARADKSAVGTINRPLQYVYGLPTSSVVWITYIVSG